MREDMLLSKHRARGPSSGSGLVRTPSPRKTLDTGLSVGFLHGWRAVARLEKGSCQHDTHQNSVFPGASFQRTVTCFGLRTLRCRCQMPFPGCLCGPRHSGADRSGRGCWAGSPRPPAGRPIIERVTGQLTHARQTLQPPSCPLGPRRWQELQADLCSGFKSASGPGPPSEQGSSSQSCAQVTHPRLHAPNSS